MGVPLNSHIFGQQLLVLEREAHSARSTPWAATYLDSSCE